MWQSLKFLFSDSLQKMHWNFLHISGRTKEEFIVVLFQKLLILRSCPKLFCLIFRDLFNCSIYVTLSSISLGNNLANISVINRAVLGITDTRHMFLYCIFLAVTNVPLVPFYIFLFVWMLNSLKHTKQVLLSTSYTTSWFYILLTS